MGQGRTRRWALGALAGMGAVAATGRLHGDITTDIANMRPGDFSWHPERASEGAVAVVVSIPEQRIHIYRNSTRIAVSTCSTGKAGHATPTGVFTVLQKDRNHHSSTYDDAPMPNMNRLTWDGIALHAGNLPGYPASHGCVRLPLEFSRRLYEVTHIGTPVIIAGTESDPWELTHPGLILGNATEVEMEDAVAKLDARSHPSDWPEGPEYPITTVLATRDDRRVSLIENGVDVIEADLGLADADPLGEHVLILDGAEAGGFRWTGITHHPNPDAPLMSEATILNRLILPGDFRKRLADSVHPGMVFIVSDYRAHPDRRSGRDFVIMRDDESSIEPPPEPARQL